MSHLDVKTASKRDSTHHSLQK